MKLLNTLLSVTAIFTFIRASYSSYKDSEENLYVPGVDSIYEKICRDISINNITIPNRPEEMEHAFIENLRRIGPVSCIPFDENQISQQCEKDLSALAKNKGEFRTRLGLVKSNIQSAATQMVEQIGHRNGTLARAIGTPLAMKIALRNLYFINYFYAKAENIGQCGQLSSLAFFNYVAELSKSSVELPSMQFISISNKEFATTGIFENDAALIHDHGFFVIGGEFPEGEFEVKIDPDKPIPEDFLKGWVCDLWNKDIVFGPIKEIAAKNKIYDLSKWKSVSIRDVSFPHVAVSEKKYDYFLNPNLFLEMLNSKKSLKLGLSDKQILRKIELPLKLNEEISEEDEPEHPEL
jgi:hypothetical protein